MVGLINSDMKGNDCLIILNVSLLLNFIGEITLQPPEMKHNNA